MSDFTLYLVQQLAIGVQATIVLFFTAALAGNVLALPVALLRMSKHKWLRYPAMAFILAFRGTPLLVQTYLLYYGLAQFDFIRESVLWKPILSQAWWCALIAFTLNTAAYTTEFLRGAIEATPHGEVEAAKASGMSYWTRIRRVILPNSFRRALPAYSNEVIFMLHGSVVASTITLQDILGVGRWLNGRYYLPYEGFVAAAILYMILVFGIARIFKWWEHKWLAHLRPRVDTKGEPAAAVQ